MGKIKKINTGQQLFKDIASLIEDSRSFVANTVNATLVLLYWKVGKRINHDVLQNKRADYGKQIVASLAQQLTEHYGSGWDLKTLRHCLRIAETFSEEIIVSATQRQLGWTHLKTIMYLKNEM